MNLRRSFFSFLTILVFLLAGCPAGHASGKEDRPDLLSSVNDSLLVLDSLVRVNSTRNAYLSQFYARKALALIRNQKNPDAIIYANLIAGVAYLPNNKDSSIYFYNRALRLSDSSRVSRRKPSIYYNLSVLYSAADYYKTALVMLDSTIIIGEREKAWGAISDAYTAMGSIKMNIRDLTDARKMFDSAYKIAEKYKLFRQMGTALSNLAKFEEDPVISINRQLAAIALLKKATGTESEIADILVNIGNRQHSPDSAIFYFKSALKLIKYVNKPETIIGAYNNMAYSYLDKGNLTQAESCVRDYGIPLAQKENNRDWLSELYDSYADILAAKGDFKGAVSYQKMATETRKQADNQQASEQVRLLASLLDLDKKELTIQAKEKEILIQQNNIQRFRLWFLASVLFVIGSIFVVLFIQQRLRARLHREQMIAAKRIIDLEEGEKGRTARELHDITGQLVMGLTGEIENIDTLPIDIKSQIKAKIAELGKSIRLISHRMNKAMLEHFTFEELVEGQCNDMQRLTGIQVKLKLPGQSLPLNEETIRHAYRIIQELLTNAGKYVKQGEVQISILSKSDTFVIRYSDNGPGFDQSKMEKPGMGFLNIHERAKLIGGCAKVTSVPGQGTTWEITAPING